MALLNTIIPFPGMTFSLWHIAEPESYFEGQLPLSEEEAIELARLNELRRLEWLASRWLLHKTTGVDQRLPLSKNAFSKPFFLDQPDLYCSLSHSHGFVGALTASENCGCDIQVLVDKMPAIASKFIREDEFDAIAGFPDSFRFELYHLFWTAKESLYKAYGLKALDFRKHIRIRELMWDGNTGTAIGRIEKDNFWHNYQLKFGKEEKEKDVLVWAVCL
ncbi:MAG: 4'-phosphopantetheinyl transferase superfamily protein [Saprospiraceae bacterium]